MIDVILQPCWKVNEKRNRDRIVAHVAELVDAADSKSAVRKGVKVRFLSWALSLLFKGGFFMPKTQYWQAF